MGHEEMGALAKQVASYAEQGIAPPVRHNINSNLSNLADRLRPDWLAHKARIGSEKASQLKKHNARVLVGAGVGVGASVGGSVAGQAVVTAAGLAVGGAVLGVAAASGIGLAAGAVIGLTIFIVKSKVVGSNRAEIHQQVRGRVASEQQLFYLLSHGELMNLARSFEKAHKAEELYNREAAAWSLGNAPQADCVQMVKLTYALLYWKKRLITALLDSPRLHALQQFQGLIEDKMVEALVQINLARVHLLIYAKRHGQEIATLHPNDYRKAPGLPEDTFFRWRREAEDLDDGQRRGLALLLSKTRPGKLTTEALNALGTIADRVKEQLGENKEKLPVAMVKDVGLAFLKQVLGNHASGLALSSSMAGSAGGALSTGAVAGSVGGFILAIPAELVANYLANLWNDRLNLEYLRNQDNDVHEKAYRLRSVLEHGRISAIHEGYKALDAAIPRLKARFQEPDRGGDAGFRAAVEVASLMQSSIYHYMVMQGMMYYVGAMLGLIESGAESAKTRYDRAKDDYAKLLERQHNGRHAGCLGTCYSADNYHPLNA